MTSSSFSQKFDIVCIFVGASLGKNAHFLEATDNLGNLLAEKKIYLVYGGGSMGLMGCVAASAYLGQVKVLGVIPKSMDGRQIIGLTFGDELRVSNMQDRIKNMVNNVVDFIGLPGGFSTLEEFFHIISWVQLTMHQKPVGLLIEDGLYDVLLNFLEFVVDKGFISPSTWRIIVCSTTPDELISKFLSYVPKLDSTIAHVVWTRIDSSWKHKLDLALTL